MKIKKVRILNSRSIQDTGDIYLEDGVTILAGKNESGKTAVLEALQDFDKDKKIRASSIPIHNPDAIPETHITFYVEPDEVVQVVSKIVPDVTVEKGLDIQLIKKFPNSYELGSESEELLTKKFKLGIEFEKKEILGELGQLNKVGAEFGIAFDYSEDELEDIAVLSKKLTDFKTQEQPKIDKMEDPKKKENLEAIFISLKDYLNEITKKTSLLPSVIEQLKNLTPRFIYFDSFNNLLPFDVAITEAKKNEAVVNFAKVADIDIDFLADADRTRQQKINYLSKKSTTITGDFLDYWNQDVVKLHAMLDGENLVFGFEEEGKSEKFSMDQRSKGFQWFLSFYIQLKMHEGENAQTYLLVDEPGLYLHAKAQRDVLSILERRSKTMPVVFSTHSPYLIEADKLFRVRLVARRSKTGTFVESKIHKVADRETLTPILTAIGLELIGGIINTDKLNNVVVEGPSDWYYLTAFKTILGIDNINFIFGGGAGNMPHVGTILQGWGSKVLYLYDNDQGKKDGVKNLGKKWIVEAEDIVAVSDKKDVRIEDLFSKVDFKEFVLEDKELKTKLSNSDYMSKTKKEKALLAKLFLAKADDIAAKLSDTSKTNYQRLFNNLVEKFGLKS